MKAAKKYKTVDEYVKACPENIKSKLQQLRRTIKQSAPEAEEVISYNMPAYNQQGVLVYFAANKHHIGFYPTASPIKIFKDKLGSYKISKGAIQFPIDKSIPLTLIKQIVKFKVLENKERARIKKQ